MDNCIQGKLEQIFHDKILRREYLVNKPGDDDIETCDDECSDVLHRDLLGCCR
jgi:hypothetical protein